MLFKQLAPSTGLGVAVERAEPSQVGHRHASVAQAAQDTQPADVVGRERAGSSGRA